MERTRVALQISRDEYEIPRACVVCGAPSSADSLILRFPVEQVKLEQRFGLCAQCAAAAARGRRTTRTWSAVGAVAGAIALTAIAFFIPASRSFAWIGALVGIGAGALIGVRLGRLMLPGTLGEDVFNRCKGVNGGAVSFYGYDEGNLRRGWASPYANPSLTFSFADKTYAKAFKAANANLKPR